MGGLHIGFSQIQGLSPIKVTRTQSLLCLAIIGGALPENKKIPARLRGQTMQPLAQFLGTLASSKKHASPIHLGRHETYAIHVRQLPAMHGQKMPQQIV